MSVLRLPETEAIRNGSKQNWSRWDPKTNTAAACATRRIAADPFDKLRAGSAAATELQATRLPLQRSRLRTLFVHEWNVIGRDDCISAASRSTRPLPRGFTGHVAHPSRSIETRLLPTLTRSYPPHFTFYVAEPLSSIRVSPLLIKISKDFATIWTTDRSNREWCTESMK